TLVHGAEAYEQAVNISAALFSGEVKQLNAEEIKQGFKNVPSYQVQAEDDLNLVEILLTAEIEKSKRQAREDITNGAIYINGDRIQDVAYTLSDQDKLVDEYIVVRRGKKKYFVLQF
ncbi:MAG: S4 domain-containing protein, partial [Enterococcus viikkiensis]